MPFSIGRLSLESCLFRCNNPRHRAVDMVHGAVVFAAVVASEYVRLDVSAISEASSSPHPQRVETKERASSPHPRHRYILYHARIVAQLPGTVSGLGEQLGEGRGCAPNIRHPSRFFAIGCLLEKRRLSFLSAIGLPRGYGEGNLRNLRLSAKSVIGTRSLFT